MSVVEIIQHYQRSIEKCSENEERMMHCISKLYRLPVTVQHLQETGVGRTVNALRKYEGDVGEAAKALVAKWKTMVADEESSEGDIASEDETNVPDPPEDHGNHSYSRKHEKDSSDERKESRHRSQESKERQENKSNRSESSKHSSKNGSTEHSKSKDSHNKSLSTNRSEKHKHSRSEVDKQESRNDSKDDKDRRDSKHDARSDRKSKSDRVLKSDKESGSDKHDSRKEAKHKPKDKDRSKSNDSKKDSSKVSGNSKLSRDDRVSEDNHRKRSIDSSSERESSKKRKYSESDSGEDNTQHSSASEDDNEKFLPELSEESGSGEEVPKIEIKREPPSPPPKSKDISRRNDESRTDKKSCKDKTRDGHSSSKSKHSGMSDKSRRDEDEDKKKGDKEEDKMDHRKSEKRKDEGHHSNRESSKSKSHSSSSSSSRDKIRDKDNDKDKHKDQHKVKKENKNSSSDVKDVKVSASFKEPKEKKKIKKEMNGDEGIDCNSGASFAEALGMCAFPMPVSRKRNNNSPNLSPVKTIKTEPGTPSTSYSKPPVKVKIETPLSSDSSPPSLLAPNVKLEPLSVDLASTLPEISPNYKPLPYVNPLHRKQEEDRALSEVIYAKNQRTKVYSGNKCGYTNVPSLYEICIRVLIENIEALEFTGGVPFDIIKPVLERATADQLYMLEHHNPYLIEDTDALWQFHCTREFRTKKREEMESWREMYMRCLDEREAKLKALTANIKQSQDKSLPVSKTKLAYVDNIVKPPRNVLRKQAKYGTAKPTSSTSDLKHKLISGGGGAIPTNISVPAPPMPRSRMSTSTVVKKTKAPLMAKALQLIKGRYKR